MADNKITIELGRVPKERGLYVSGAKYYKDNIVEYRGAAYIADPINFDSVTNPNAYVTVAPWTTDRDTLNTGWRVFADGNPGYVEEVAEENIRLVNEALAAYTPVVVEGDVTNVPDEEDITSTNVGGTDVLKFKDKAYASAAYSGMGRVYLRKNMVNGVNTLTQDMLYKGEVGSRVPNTNTIFIIQYDYDLNNAEITIPENCVLKFDGGSIDNGKVVFQDTGIESIKACFGADLEIEGKVLEEASPEWFVGTDADKIEKAIDIFSVVKLAARDYIITRSIITRHSFTLKGSSIPDFFGDTYNGSETTVSDFSSSRLIGNFSNDDEEYNSIIYIKRSEGQPRVSRYVSVSFDHISFITGRDYTRLVTGVGIKTPGGPSRPIIFNCCNFKYLKYGIRIFGSTTETSTNVSNLSVRTCTFHRNDWGIHITGVHAVGEFTMNNCLCEGNATGGVSCYSDNDNVIYGSVSITDCMLESNPEPIKLNLTGRATITGNYFEESNDITSTITIVGSTLGSYLVLSSHHSSNGSNKFEYVLARITVENFDVTPQSIAPKVRLAFCHVKKMSKVLLNKVTLTAFELKEESRIFDVPSKTVKLSTVNYVGKDGNPYYIANINGHNRKNVSIPVGYTYRAVCRLYNTSIANAIELAMPNPNGLSIPRTHLNHEVLLVNDVSNIDGVSSLTAFYSLADPNYYTFMYLSRTCYMYNITTLAPFADNSYIPNPNFHEDAAFNNILNPFDGLRLFDESIKRDVIYKSGVWKDADGFTPALHKGDTNSRPSESKLESGDIGFPYTDTTLKRNLHLDVAPGEYLYNSSTRSTSISNTFSNGEEGYFLVRSTQVAINSYASICFQKSVSDETDKIEIKDQLTWASDNKSAQGYIKAPDPSIYTVIVMKVVTWSGNIFFRIAKIVKKWREEDGAAAGVLRSGATADRPVGSDIYVGFMYMDTTLGKPIYANAISGDTVTWVDSLGNPVDTVYPKVIGTTTTGNLAKFNSTNIEDAGVAPQV